MPLRNEGGPTGREGEDVAAAWLVERGYRIEGRNVRGRHGELDLVACKGPLTVFVEVKTRSSGAWGSPAEAIGVRKQQRLVRTAGEYLHKLRRRPGVCRFDVIEVERDGARWSVRHLPDAFRPGWP